MSDERRSKEDEKTTTPGADLIAVGSPLVVSASRPTWTEINLDNLVHNFRLMKQHAGPGVAVMPAVKADAYGHGARECARVLEQAGADWFGVATAGEGDELRKAGISRPILCLGGLWIGEERLAIAKMLTPAVYRVDQLERLDAAAAAAGCSTEYHLKIDTGMGRLGVPSTELTDFLSAAARFKHVRLDGLMTHLASADIPEQAEFSHLQTSLFDSAIAQVSALGFRPSWIHEANSAAAHSFGPARGKPLNLIRPGGVLYGLWRDVTNPLIPPMPWRPVMSLRTRIIHLKRVSAKSPLGYGGTFVTSRESLIATLPIGYADGLRRAESNLGRVLVRGKAAPIVGRVSMDLTLVDVTDVEEAEVGDEVVAIGGQGSLEITAEDIASEIGTISYEVTCGISGRVPRVYDKSRD